MVSRLSQSADVYVKSGQNGHVEIPILYYPGYQAYDESGTQYQLYAGQNSRISFDIPAGFDGTISIRFEDPLTWKIAAIGSAAAWVCVCIYLTRKKPAAQ